MLMYSRRRRGWVAMLQVLLLLALMVAPASAATSSLPTGPKWLTLLQTYDIVRGDQYGNLNLSEPITRAQMVTIMVRALGGEQDAKLFKGLNPFTDVQGHWAEAEIAYAAVRKYVRGDGNGSFRPDAYISYAESLTLLLRMIGKEPIGGDWPYNVLMAAGELNLVPEGVTASNIKVEATRGLVFQSMSKAISEIYDEDGKNFLQKFVDDTPPVLSVTLPGSSKDASLTVNGTVTGATAVKVNGKDVAIVKDAFSTAVTLEYGANSIVVEARDLAGNVDRYSATVTRDFPITVLGITGPEKVAPGGTQTYEIAAADKDGNPVSLDLVTVSVEGGVGTFDKATGTLKVANTPGVKGQIVVSAGSLSRSVNVTILGPSTTASRLSINTLGTIAYTKPMTVTVQVLDSSGAVAAQDYGRPVTLAATGMEGVTVSPSTAQTAAGVATFTVRATKMGQVTLNAQSPGLESASRSGTFGSTRRIRLIADPASLVVGSANSMSRIKAELLNEDGQVVNNDTGEVIGITVRTQSDAGALTDTNLSIGKGVATSTMTGNDGMFSVMGMAGGTANITGEISAGPALTVEPVTLAVTVPQVGPGTRLSAIASSTVLNAPGTATFVVRLIDGAGNYIPTGEYAFQVRIDTSNGESKVAGLPSDGSLSVSLADTGLNPVDDGITEGATNDGTDIVARTTNGSATIKVTYSKAGRVTLTPIAASATNTSYNAYGTLGAASSSYSFVAEPAAVSFQKNVAGVLIRADSNLGTGQPAASIANNQASSTTLQVTLIDSSGAWVPGQIRNVTLERVADTGTDVVNTTPPPVLTLPTNDGKTSFVVRGTTTAGMDTYRATVDIDGTPLSSTINIFVESARPNNPAIASTRGYKGSIPGSLNEVGPDEDGLEIVLIPNGNKWDQARVFTENSYSPIHTTEAIDFSNSEARILVPKSKLPAGSQRYQVSLVNGFGESDRSGQSATVLNATYNSYITIQSAQYDAVGNKLYVTGSGFNYGSGYPDTINTAKLTLRDLSTGRNVPLLGAEVQITSGSSFILTLNSGMYGDFENPSYFAGSDIRLIADSGWYVRYNGEMAASDQNDNAVQPGARIKSVLLDRPNKLLYVYGEGFTTGEPAYNLFQLTYSGAPAADIFNLSLMSPTKRSDTELMFVLSDTAVARLDAIGDDLPSPEPDYVLEVTADGWFRSGYGTSAKPSSTFPIYTKLTLRSVTYTSTGATTGEITITGSGFDFAADKVFPSLMSIVDLGTTQTLALSSATVKSVNSTTIVLEITGATKSTFENTANFNGSDIYLRAQNGWAEDGKKRQAAGIGDYDLRFPSR